MDFLRAEQYVPSISVAAVNESQVFYDCDGFKMTVC